jgi:hypothetical protein
MKRFTFALALSCLCTSLAFAAFKRGDANVDGTVDISDPVRTLNYLFIGAPNPGCDDAMDGNDDGNVDISDGVYVLNFLFTGGAAPKAPYPDCGEDNSPDSLDCGSYPLCAAPCLSEEDLDAKIAESVGSTICIPADAYTYDSAQVTAMVCPASQGTSCGDPAEPGCTIQITTVDGILDIPGQKVTIHIAGLADDLPIWVKDKIFGSETTCLNDITFSGDAVMTFTTEPGTLTIATLEDPTIENAVVDLSSTGGIVCTLLESMKETFVGELITQLETAMAEMMVDLRTELVGQTLCEPE